MFNDYTVKKAVPRLVIAAILVNLSWAACQAAISTTNILGDGIGDLIRSLAIPGATGADFPTFSNMGGGTAAFSWVALIAGGAAGTIALFTGGVFAALGAILAALAALVLGFLVLMFRRFFIVTLVILSPLALVCWAIPGMEKWAKRWWDLFIKLLLMFPFVMAMFAVADVLAVVLKPTAGNFVGQLMLVFVRFAPFALMPLVFKVAGGAFGTLTGMMNDRGKGIFDRGKSWSKERAGNTNRALRKQARKDTKLGLRKSMAGLRAVGDVQKGLDRNGVRGPLKGTRAALNRAGLYGYGAAGGMEKQERTKISSNLAEQVKKQKLEFATAVVKEAILEGATIKDQQSIMKKLYDGGDEYQKTAAYEELSRTQAVEQLGKIQEETHGKVRAALAKGTPEGLAEAKSIATTYNQIQGGRYGENKAFGAHLAGDIDIKRDETTGAYGVKDLSTMRASNLASLSDEGMAGQKGDTWAVYASVDAVGAAKRFQTIETKGGGAASKLASDGKEQILKGALGEEATARLDPRNRDADVDTIASGRTPV